MSLKNFFLEAHKNLHKHMILLVKLIDATCVCAMITLPVGRSELLTRHSSGTGSEPLATEQLRSLTTE